MLEKIIKWGEKEEAVKALILLGSLARHKLSDSYSDYDISVFCDNSEPFIESEEWLSQFGNVWICVKEKIVYKGKTFPTRLILYDGGIKVDFSFLTTKALDEIAHSNPLPDEYNLGYKVLLDKENKTNKMLLPTSEIKPVKPTEEEFHRFIEEFWFEVYHVGIYLKRNDLWSVKSRSWAAYNFLLQMIIWNTEANSNWQFSPPPNGKRMFSWVEKEIWQNLHNVFAHFDASDSWNALFNLMELFKQITHETASLLKFDNKEDISKNIIQFITTLKSSS